MAKRLTKEPTIFLRKLYAENPDNVYFKPYGLAFDGRYVGEFYIGDVSVNEYLIQKGICKYVN